jgi:endogenous inhibitor of DNA gyrase (YacG/DUF329 family)
MKEKAMQKATNKKCRRCQTPLTWARTREQYGRMIQRGLTPERAKMLSPCCSKCTTIVLQEQLSDMHAAHG